MKKILSFALLVTLAAACSPKSPKAKQPVRAGNLVVTQAPSTNQPTWNWDAYPAVKKMRLAMLPCTLQPRSQITINSTLAGSVKIYIATPQTNLPVSTVWGEFEPTIFEAEAQALEEARVKIDERERVQREIELPKLRLKLEHDIEEMKYQVAKVRYLSTNTEMAQKIFSVGDNKSVLRPDSLTKIEEEFRLANLNLTYVNETNSAVLTMDVGTLRSEWQRRKLEFEHRRAQATLKMPFNGQLTVSLPLAEGIAEYPVNLGQELGVARDLSIVRLRVPFANPTWSALAPERLYAVVRLPSGQELEAPFAYNKVERVQNREESAYYFQFSAEQTPLVTRLIGTDVTCELWLNIGQVTHVVPKLALIMHNPSAFQSGNWSAGVALAFPGSRLAIEGQTDLAIIVPPKTVIAAAR
jgi:hypothetical protein